MDNLDARSIVAYFISKFDKEAYSALGYGEVSQVQAHTELGALFGTKGSTFKNIRDTFDPLHEHRVGWNQKPLNKKLQKIVDSYSKYTFNQLFKLCNDLIDAQRDNVSKLKELILVMNTAGNGANVKLYKPLVLLSVLEMIDTGSDNCFPSIAVQDIFNKLKQQYNVEAGNEQFAQGYYRLANDGIWTPTFKDENDIINSDTKISYSNVTKKVDHMSFSDEIWEQLRDGEKREQIRQFIVDKWFNTESDDPFSVSVFLSAVQNAGLNFDKKLLSRFTSSLLTKPFVLLSGLSGSGKTKLAQAFAEWICRDHDTQICVVPVGADWTNREPLLGYVNALNTEEYVLPENGALQLLIEANKLENRSKPYFLILDEMNLSHVERYFADFLSVMESKDTFKLHSEESKSEVPSTLEWPSNLFVIGTVNIDETTYMFSPKVLDRANVIEFRVSEKDIKDFLIEPKEIDLDELKSEGTSMASTFVSMASKNAKITKPDKFDEVLLNFFKVLRNVGTEFGYRTSMEICSLCHNLAIIDPKLSDCEKIDIAVMQKLLPKLHGSRSRLCPVLQVLGGLCVADNTDTGALVTEVFDLKKGPLIIDEEKFFKDEKKVKYPLSLEKIARMYKSAVDNGFASYAEA